MVDGSADDVPDAVPRVKAMAILAVRLPDDDNEEVYCSSVDSEKAILTEDKVVEEKVHDDVEAPVGDLNEVAEVVSLVGVESSTWYEVGNVLDNDENVVGELVCLDGLGACVLEGDVVDVVIELSLVKCKSCAFKEHVEYPNECLDEEKVKGGTIAC